MTLARSSRAKKVDEHPLYSGAQRIWIPFMLFLIIASDASILTYAIFSKFVVSWELPGILTSILIPLVATIASVFQFVQRARRSLGSVQVVVFGTIATLVWLAYGCMGIPTGNYSNQFYEPWAFLAVPGVFLNIVYLSFGAAAVHAAKKNQIVEDMDHTPIDLDSARHAALTTATTSMSSRPPSYRSSEETILPPSEKDKELV